MHFDVVVNPAGASGKTKKTWEKLEAKYVKKGYDLTAHFSTRQCGIEQLCRQLTTMNRECNLIIVGGDGSLNEAINGIQDFSNVRLGYIPTGSGNDFAKGIDIGKDPDAILGMILEGNVRRMLDIGEVTFHGRTDRIDAEERKVYPGEIPGDFSRRFVVSCGIGFDALVCERAILTPVKSFLNSLKIGKMIYTVIAIQGIFQSPRFSAKVKYDDGEEKVYDKCLFLAGMNNRFEGGGFMFCPKAVSDDGILDVVTTEGLTAIDVLRILPSAYNGGHVGQKGIGQERCHTMEIKADTPLWVHTDGEVAHRSEHITMRLMEHKLAMFI